MAPRKNKLNAGTSLGVSLSATTRAKLDLIAAGLDRPIGWLIREAISAYLADGKEIQYRQAFPKLAEKIDLTIKAATEKE